MQEWSVHLDFQLYSRPYTTWVAVACTPATIDLKVKTAPLLPLLADDRISPMCPGDEPCEGAGLSVDTRSAETDSIVAAKKTRGGRRLWRAAKAGLRLH